MSTRGFMKRFFDINIALSNRIEKRLPGKFTKSLLHQHELLVTEEIRSRPNGIVLDIGGGRNSPFARHSDSHNMHIIAADIDFEELAANQQVKDKLVLDATGTLPFRTNSIDLIVTRSVLEHLPETETFALECERVLAPQGKCLHVMPCKFAPFALINQTLPNKVAQAILYRIYPQWTDSCGFKAYYRNCYIPRMPNLFKKNNLTLERVEVRYYQSIYFKFLFPVYLLSVLYDLVLFGLDARPLACQALIVARKS